MNNMIPQPQSQPSWEDVKNMILATSEQMKETDRKMQETDRKMQETDRIIKENARQMKELEYRFFSQAGHIIEGLMEPSAIRMFQEKGYDIDCCYKNFKKFNKGIGKKIELDLLLIADTKAIVVEVKINCTRRDIDHFIQQMGLVKKLCPEYADKEIHPAIASVNYDRDADAYAHEQGLFVIRVYNDNIFSLDSTDGDKLLKF
ncbi:MAG: hypothetical protein J5644_08450 [Bacteroidales bacterium]|nr:hypothetical protein [Bacteroidales bacterium]